MSELLPCPHCGGSDIRIDRHAPEKSSPTGEIWSMCCYTCGATFPNRYMKELLVDAWNRRATPKAAAQGAEAVAVACSKCGSVIEADNEFRRNLVAAYLRDRERGLTVEFHCVGVGAECGKPLTAANIFRCGDCGQTYCLACLKKHFVAHTDAAPSPAAGVVEGLERDFTAAGKLNRSDPYRGSAAFEAVAAKAIAQLKLTERGKP